MYLVLILFILLSASVSADWAQYGGDPSQSRYSPLTQITPANVASLRVAWTYDTEDAFPGSEMQCQPVVARGILYAASPKLRVFALDAASGTPKWSFSPDPDATKPTRTRIRGLMYWERGADLRIFLGVMYCL
jgi:quinoprotein glucose dehydrogenase